MTWKLKTDMPGATFRDYPDQISAVKAIARLFAAGLIFGLPGAESAINQLSQFEPDKPLSIIVVCDRCDDQHLLFSLSLSEAE